MRILIVCMVALVLLAPALAQEGHLTLLTVAEDPDLLEEAQGGTADLYLDIKPGTGQIFIDSFPLTKLDTQSSTRYANQVACAHVDADCSRYDFFYTIRAGSPVVGGPSAGAAMAVLTAALLEGRQPDESIAITGTINSGGIIGPVAGEKAKAEAAASLGITKVLISAFSYPTELNTTYLELLNVSLEERNLSLNLSKLYVPVDLSEAGVPVVKVATLEEALSHFTGAEVEPPRTLEPPKAYNAIMEDVAAELCDRRAGVAAKLEANESLNRTIAREAALAEGDWYSAASFCFSDLIDLRAKDFRRLSADKLKTVYAILLRDSAEYQSKLDQRSLDTLAELETYVIVSTRVQEARDALRDENRSNLSARTLGFAYERANSAEAWSAFFRMESPAISLDDEHLEAACDARIAETEERISYAELYLPEEYLEEALAELTDARQESLTGRYALCLFHASKAEAMANLLAGTLSVPEENIPALIDGKLAVAASVIAQQQERGSFPILGYSYYQYASSLKESDPYSALTFAEYALELSNLDIYFPKQQSFRMPEEVYYALLFLTGVVLGAGLATIITVKVTKKVKKKSARKKRR